MVIGQESDVVPPDQWWYATASETVDGPVTTASFVALFAAGHVDGLTRVSDDVNAPKDDWLALVQHPELREKVRSGAQEDDESGLTPGDSTLQPDGGEELLVQDAHPANGPPFSDREEEADGDAVQPQNGTEGAQTEGHSLADGTMKAQPVETLPDLDKAMERERKRQARKRKRDAQRLKRRTNTSVYISGVATDATEEQLAEHFAKCGIILPSADTGRPRVKLYTDESGNRKGDALVTYAMEASVENAVTILDGVPLRSGGQAMQVQRASFDHKKDQGTSENDGPAKRKREEGNEEKKARAGFRSRDLIQEALSWAEEGQEVAKAPRIVILKNVFDANDADYDMVREDMEEGCAACGAVEKVTVFERNAEGTVAVKFTTLEACVQCMKVMKGRWYDGRKLSAEFYDGETDYRYKETENDRSQRERKWQHWLEHGEENVETNTAPAQPDK